MLKTKMMSDFRELKADSLSLSEVFYSDFFIVVFYRGPALGKLIGCEDDFAQLF